MPDYAVVGKSVPRVDAVEKVTGEAKYGVDVNLPGMLYGKFLRSPYHHARLLHIDTSQAERLPGVKAVITGTSLSAGQSLTTDDTAHGRKVAQDLFALTKVRYQGEKIAAVAAIDPDIAEDAVSLITVEYELLPPVLDVLEAMQPDAPLVFEDAEPVKGPHGELLYNVGEQAHGDWGDVEKAFQAADLIVEGTYTASRVHQTYMEPHGVVADVDSSGRVTCWTSTQGIFAIRSGLSSSLGIPISRINVIGMTIGGGFGGKFGMLVHPYAVLLSQRSGRPVKIVLSREEEFLDGRPAPGLRIWIKTAAKKDGTIIGRQAIAYWDSGASPGAGCGMTGRIRGVYNIPNIKYDAYGIYTNKPGPAAYRAPSSPQVAFASEAQLDQVARELNIDPVDLRLKNMLETGSPTLSGGNMPSVAFKETLKAVADHVGWYHRKKGPNEGWGVAVGEWTNGAGPGGAVISIHEDGIVRISYGMVDLTGTDTAMAQIAAEVLGVPFDQVVIHRGDTDSVPYAPGSGGSLVTFSMGNTVIAAAADARRRIFELAAAPLDTGADNLELRDGKVCVKGDPDRSMTLVEVANASFHSTGGPIVGRGGFANKPSGPVISAQIAHLKVDPETGNYRILRYAGSLDVGKAINPMAVEGQMEGGAAQSISWGMMEEMKYNQDRNLNPSLLDYQIPTTLDLPPKIESIIVESPIETGPFGAKGIGEPPIIPALAALSNAVYDAIGVRLTDAPITPERIVQALRRNGK